MMSPFRLTRFGAALALVCLGVAPAFAGSVTTNPYLGVTYIDRTETSPRAVHMHIAKIDLTAPGLDFKLTTASGTRETRRQTTTDFLTQEQAQLGINTHFFNPVDSPSALKYPDVYLAGLSVSRGTFVSNFDDQPCSAEFPGTNQNYAIVPYGPALNIDPSHHASIVHRDPAFADNQHTLENVTLWNALEGSAQIITNGVLSVPYYKDATHPDGLLTSNGTYSNTNSWYNAVNARTAIGINQDGTRLILFTIDRAGGSTGMTVGEVANILPNDYDVYNALNLDGGGSTALAMQDPSTGTVKLMNASSNNGSNSLDARPEGSNFAVFASPIPEPASITLLGLGAVALLCRRK